MTTPPAGVRFSVVVPAYNEADYLPTTLASLRDQDFGGRYEVVVVDNGSSDDTADVARASGARVVEESTPGVCAARQRGVDAALGEIVVSTDADTEHPRDWLSRLDTHFAETPHAVAVAGPCRYADPPWWAAVFPPLWFAAHAAAYAWFGRVGYVTATNVAFRRDGFPGYDTRLTQGGDETDLLRRLRGWGQVVWAADIAVTTSSRRMDQGLAHTLFVSYGFYYWLSGVLNRRAPRTVIGRAPAIRRADESVVRRRRARWRLAVLAGTGTWAALRIHGRSAGRGRG